MVTDFCYQHDKATACVPPCLRRPRHVRSHHSTINIILTEECSGGNDTTHPIKMMRKHKERHALSSSHEAQSPEKAVQATIPDVYQTLLDSSGSRTRATWLSAYRRSLHEQSNSSRMTNRNGNRRESETERKYAENVLPSRMGLSRGSSCALTGQEARGRRGAPNQEVAAAVAHAP